MGMCDQKRYGVSLNFPQADRLGGWGGSVSLTEEPQMPQIGQASTPLLIQIKIQRHICNALYIYKCRYLKRQTLVFSIAL